MFVLPPTQTSTSSADRRARSRSRPRRETPSPTLNSSSNSQSAAAPFVPRGPSSANSATRPDTHGQGAVLPPVSLKVEYSKSSQQKTTSASGRRRRSSSVVNVDIGAVKTGTRTSSTHTPVPDANQSPDKKGHARRGSWQRRLSIGGSASLSASSLDRLDGVQRRSSVSSPKSPPKQSAFSEAEKSVASLPSSDVPVLPRKTNGFGSTSTTASTTGTPSSPAVTPLTQASSASPSDYFGPRAASLKSPPGKVRSRQASESRSPRKEDPSEARERRKLQKRNTSSDTTWSKASQETVTTKRNASTDTTQEVDKEREKEKEPGKQKCKEKREKDKKTMLSRALQKAHTAVLLDNAQNFEGAIQAYADACNLLKQVLVRSSVEEDQRKLDAIRNTYENRILELQQLSPDSQIHGNRKSLPARPMSDSLSDQSPQLIFEAADEESEAEPVVIETAIAARISPDKPPEPQAELQQKTKPPPIALTPSESNNTESEPGINGGLLLRLQSDNKGSVVKERFLALESPMDASYIPPPLSPRRLPSNESQQPGTPKASTFAPPQQPQPSAPVESQQQGSSGHQSMSWLDTIDESARNSISSATSSVHSLAENGMFMRKNLRELTSTTEAEFDAALDAAVEAAYDDGLEPLNFNNERQGPRRSLDPVAAALANVALAKSRVKEVEREEAILAAHRRHLALRTQKDPGAVSFPRADDLNGNFIDEDLDAEDEERILNEMTKEYLVDGFDFGLGGSDKEIAPVLPPQPTRQSDSSTYSGRTWNTSTSSSRTTGGTSLSAVAEGGETTSPTSKTINGLPPLDEEGRPSTASESSSVTVTRVLSSGGQRDSLRLRRLSGQNAKQLKIETSIPPAKHEPATAGPRLQQATLKIDPPPRSASSMRDDLQTLPSSVFKPPGSTLQQPPPSYFPQSGSPMPSVSPGGESVRTSSPATPALLHMPIGAEGASPGGMKIPPRPQVRKNKSSVSLKQRNMSISGPDSPDAMSIGTPLSTSFSNRSQKNLPLPSVQPATPGLPSFNFPPTGVATAAAAADNLNLPSGGMSLFESADLHSPYSPGIPNPMAQNAPIPIEPCPESPLLRPFWLMRCIYQTIAHPRGGYLSTRLFVPRDVWRVKGVKIKSVEEKIANCDLLTAALGRLAAVDTLDMDAVHEEMQGLETVLDQCQNSLTKKLGSEVGVQGANAMFKDAPGAMADASSPSDGSSGGLRTASGTTTGGKSYLSGWRKLRSKGSSVNLPTTGSMGMNKEKGEAAGWTMQSVPMTSLANIRFAKRDIRGLEQGLEGPNRAYMGAVARLCDAVQVVDQIARQVEDPGLKQSSPTHVGLELCTRHASEFFGFYVARFVLADLGMLMDKFIKRGSEWVLI